MRATIIEKIGPYDGEHTKNLITFKLKTESSVITWHETGSRGLKNAKIRETYIGLELKGSRPDYKKSKLVLTQLKLEL